MNQLTTLYVNGTVLTMDREVPSVEALLVREGRIAALGPRVGVEEQAPPNARRIDLNGGTVVPGFNDCHCHILNFGLTLEQLDVGPENAGSIGEIQETVRRHAERTPDDEWIIGRGYDQSSLEERRHPTRWELDEASPQRPLVLWQTSGHALACNSRALELAGVTGSTDTPAGGDIERDEHGEPNGVLKEAPAMDLIRRAIPAPTLAQGVDAIVRAMDVMASQGITSATEASADASEIPMYVAAAESGRLAGRITLMPEIELVAPPDSDETVSPLEFDFPSQSEWLTLGAVKIYADGALTTRTAALHEPFAGGGDNTGLLIWEPDMLASMIRRAHDAGWQIATHAIGDRAIDIVLDGYEAALQATPRDDHRHRIEHCMVVSSDQATRIQQLGVVPVIQPGFIGRLGDAYIQVLGLQRASQLMPMERFDWLNIPVGFSSDRPVIPGAPLKGIRSAMQRITRQGTVLGREHTITSLEAIRHYTSGSAFASRAEQSRGTLVRGMQADFTVLNNNPAETTADEFATRIRVEMTVTGGFETFQ